MQRVKQNSTCERKTQCKFMYHDAHLFWGRTYFSEDFGFCYLVRRAAPYNARVFKETWKCMLNMYTATIKTMFANFYDQNFQLTVVGRTGLCGVHVQ